MRETSAPSLSALRASAQRRKKGWLDSGIFLIAFQGPLPLSGSSLVLDQLPSSSPQRGILRTRWTGNVHHSEFSAQLYLGLAVVILESPGLITPLPFCLLKKQDCR